MTTTSSALPELRAVGRYTNGALLHGAHVIYGAEISVKYFLVSINKISDSYGGGRSNSSEYILKGHGPAEQGAVLDGLR